MDAWNSCYRGIPPEDRPCYTWTDSGCKLWPYINNNEELFNLWKFTQWLIDRAHAIGTKTFLKGSGIGFVYNC